MIQFTATIAQFDEQGEKTGWMYISVPGKLATQLKPDHKKSFRVKGSLDQFAIKGVALLPMGGGDFIMPFNAAMRKGTGKRKGATVKVRLEVDTKPLVLNRELMACLSDEPAGLAFFNALPKSVQHYYSKWVDSAKTEQTRTKRIALAVSALARKMNFTEMLREEKRNKDEVMRRPG